MILMSVQGVYGFWLTDNEVCAGVLVWKLSVKWFSGALECNSIEVR